MPPQYLSTIAPERPGPWAADPARACAKPGIDPDWFFPGKGGNHPETDMALAICRTCPVMAECRAYALDQPALHGIWGATTVRMRRNMRRNRRLEQEAA